MELQIDQREKELGKRGGEMERNGEDITKPREGAS